MTEFFYQWHKSDTPKDVPLPAARYLRGVREAFYWTELLDNNACRWGLSDLDTVISIGVQLSCRAFWRGRNRSNNERMRENAPKKPKSRRPKGMRSNIQD